MNTLLLKGYLILEPQKNDKGNAMVPVQTDMPSAIPQYEARQWVPPGTHIWMGLGQGEWCGHCAPRARISFSWFLHTESCAMWLCIKNQRKQYLEQEGPAADHCPFKGQLDDKS